MKVVTRPKAADDLETIFSWIAKDNPSAAVRMVRRLRERIERLGTPGLAHIGRLGLFPVRANLSKPPISSSIRSTTRETK
jgi:plasmid stabilization system protein ParE